jgi:hypothetical protein
VHAAQTERRRVRRFVHRVVQAWELRPEGLRREVQQPEAARIVCPVAALRLVRAAAVRPAVPAADRPARPSAVAAPMVPVRWPAELSVAQPLAEPKRVLQLAEVWVAQPLAGQPQAEAVLAQQLVVPAGWAEAAAEVLREQAAPRALAVQPKVAQAAWDAAAVPQPVAASVAAGLPPEERAGQDVAEAVLPQEAVPDVAAERLPGVVPDVAAERLQEVPAARVSEVPLPAALGAVCACEGTLANCATVRAVVASSASRMFVMNLKSPEKFAATNKVLVDRSVGAGDQQITIRPHCGGVQTRCRFILAPHVPECAFIHGAFRRYSLRVLTSCPTALNPVSRPAPNPADRRYRRRSRDRACAAPLDHGPATHRACGPAVPAAAAAHQARVPAAEFRAADFPAALPAAARSAGPGSQAGFLAGRSASRAFRNFNPVYQRRVGGNVPSRTSSVLLRVLPASV